MNTNVIRELDKHGRITLGLGLMRLCNLEVSSCVAICRVDDNKIMIRNTNDIKDCIVIATCKIDCKGRIYMQKEIINETRSFSLFVLNGNLIIEKAH